MAQYRTGTSSQPRQSGRQNYVIPGGIIFLSAVILGVFILIAGINVGSGLKKLSAALEAKTFSDSFTSPDTISVNPAVGRKYLTQSEAAAYLNVSEAEITEAIADKKINEYIATSEGYSISIEALDDFFSDEAYDIQVKLNTN